MSIIKFSNISLAIALLWLITFATESTKSQPIYEYKGSLPPLKLTYSDLDRLTIDLNELIDRFRSSDKGNYPLRFSFTIRSESITLRDSSLNRLLTSVDLPNRATGFDLTAFNVESKDSSITKLTIYADSWNITWEIQGIDRVLLDAIRSRIEAFGDEHQSRILGPSVKMIFVVMLFGLGLFGFAVFPFGNLKRKAMIFGNVFCVLLIVLPWYLLISGILDSWFPNVAIYKGTASLIEKHAPLIAFLGFLVTLVMGIGQILIALKTGPKDQGEGDGRA